MIDPADEYKRLGKYIEAELQKRGMTQSELARKAGVSRSGINVIIKGQNKPSTNLLKEISKALGIPIETLYREAGFLPDEKEPPFLEKVNQLVSELPEKDQQDILEFIELKILKNQRG
jgi:transcriptional regulator with XRE-family HTH domain